jgi:hypothetical protein
VVFRFECPSSAATSQPLSAMRHSNFHLYFGGQLISNIGRWMQIIAQAWMVYQFGHGILRNPGHADH